MCGAGDAAEGVRAELGTAREAALLYVDGVDMVVAKQSIDITRMK